MDRPVQLSVDDPPGDRSRAVAADRTVARAPEVRRPAPPSASLEPTLVDYFWAVIERRWTVLGVMCASVALTLAYLLLAPRVYEASALLQVENRAKLLPAEDPAPSLPDRSPVETSIELIRSRTVMGAAVDQLGLDIEARPVKRGTGEERIQVRRLLVSHDLLDKPLLLTALGAGRYRLEDPDGEALLEGSVGAPASAGSRIDLVVSELVARPGMQFRLAKHGREEVIDGLEALVRVQERGKSSGILSVELEGRDASRVADTVNAIATAFVRQSGERESAEAAEKLAAVESQLPMLRSSLDEAETALNDFRRSENTVNLSDETQAMLTRQAELERERSALELKLNEKRQTFRDDHPSVITALGQVASIKSQQDALSARLRELPEAEVGFIRLTQRVKDARQFYDVMLAKARELRVMRSISLGNARIVDRAHRPSLPARPKSRPLLALGSLLGVGLGVGAALLRAVVQGAEDAEEVERAAGLPVYATIPHSEPQARLQRVGPDEDGAPWPLLSADSPGDSAVEAVRGLRVSLQFALAEARNNIVALAGPAPGVGKSFVALNLAHVHAAAGTRVVLVDADLRRGCLHRHFGLARQPGLSDVLTGTVSLERALGSAAPGSLHVLPTGKIPPNPAEMLSSQRLGWLLDELSRRFDLVIVDTPPILAVSDSLSVARLAGLTFLVLRAGQHPHREIALAVKQFALNGIRLHGAVLNDVRTTRGRYGRYGRYTQYQLPPDSPRPRRAR